MSRSIPRAPVRAALGSLCLCLAAGAQAAFAPPAAVHADDSAVPSEAAGSSAPWWTALGEPTLIVLQRAAQSEAGSAVLRPRSVVANGRRFTPDAQVAAAYIAMRVLNVRLMLALASRDGAAQFEALAAAGSPTREHAAAIAALKSRIADAERRASALLMRRDEFITLLAAWCGTTSDAMMRTLQPALLARDMPVFNAETPVRLPRAVLASRDDVHEVRTRAMVGRKAMRHADHLAALQTQTLGGWIEAASAPAAGEPSAPVAATFRPDDEELARVAAAAELEVSADLSVLQRFGRETATLHEVLRTRQVELAATRRRVELGAGSPLDVIRVHRRLLDDGDRLAVASGELAQAWIRLQASTGGQALAATSAAHD